MILNFNIQNTSSKYTDNHDQNNWVAALFPAIITSIATIITEGVSSNVVFSFSVTIKRCILYSAAFISVIAVLFALFYIVAYISKHWRIQLSSKYFMVLCVASLSTIFLCGCMISICTTLPNSSSIVYEELLNRIPFNVQIPVNR